MGCPECARLKAEHESKALAYRTAVEALYLESGSEVPPDYRNLGPAVDFALLAMEAARRELEAHERTHSK
jgi:hypothetical protein